MRYPINISFDTNIFDACQYDLKAGSPLETLIQYVKQGLIKVTLSNVVVNEMKNHCKEKALKAFGNLESCIQACNLLNLPVAISKQEKKGFIVGAEQFIDSFIRSIDAYILDYSNVSIEGIFNDYFNRIPPFEEKKKEEFPDAVIVTQIKDAFDRNNNLFFITRDTGVKKALESVPNCKIYSELSDVFDLISKDKEDYPAIRQLIYKNLKHIKEDIFNMLHDNSNITLIGKSHDSNGNIYGYDYNDIIYNIIDIDSLDIFTIDYYDQNIVTARLTCSVYINAKCTYNESNDFRPKILTEKHHANFAVSIIINRETETTDSISFHLFLGGDSRICRFTAGLPTESTEKN